MTARFFAPLAGLGLLAACAMPPEGVTPVDLVAFDEAVASIGCDLVGESDYLPVELQTGLTREQVIQTAAFRVASEQAVKLENGGVRLITGSCAPE
ncbi:MULTISPECIES: hypothetical protein [Marivita]|uniref:NADH dehydrogenase n=1 Tax=Marivita cryptomonadis TaxID=505252 RepID=A0A9Q2P511_9RHOB|nr:MULTISPECIES: hypothetical protein [Marivita]MCR9170623.1 hypothetical protein [Paracoccaceae bacterium]MBM2322395.1 hypothetical protein [Marivita cryptomonadis]MBM2331977.1 hypothetical protein [Marivita cryptomonadis]MBM2341561.1 hypothetical protein [Marivita cryptomonadis]MBM2346225.1 hypothetical protein [Marivita cryptomonadis]